MNIQAPYTFVIDVPTFAVLLSLLVSVIGVFIRIQDNQKAMKANHAAILKIVTRNTAVIAIWRERMKSFPLHAHIGEEILYPPSHLIESDEEKALTEDNST